MLVESSFSGSAETRLLNVSEYKDTYAAYDWVSLAETYQMKIHKFPEQSQVSFLEAVPVPEAMNLGEITQPKLQVSCPEKCGVRKGSEKGLANLVYSRRKKSVEPGNSAEDKPQENKKQDDSLDPGSSTKRKNRFDNCLVYSRKKRRGISSCNFTGETKVMGDGLGNASASEHDCGETKRRGNRFDNCLVYRRKKDGRKSNSCSFSEHVSGGTKRRGNRFDNCLVYRRKKDGLKSNSCSFSEHVSGGTKISDGQDESSACRQSEQIVTADGAFSEFGFGEINKCGDQLVKSNGSFTESHIGEKKINGDKSSPLLMYSQRKLKGKSVGVRVNGFLVYQRRKLRGKSVGVRVNGFLVYVRKKLKAKSRGNLTGHDPRETRVTEVTCFSDGRNGTVKPSSEIASGSGKTGEDEAIDCNSSDAEMSDSDIDGSSGPFRPCQYCDKPVTIEKMLICDHCEGAYHPSCCGIRIKDVSEVNEWLCLSCLKKHLSKGRNLPKRKGRVRGPFVIGIRIGKEFQADVPDWSGPIMSDTSFVGQPLEIDESEHVHDLNKAKNGKKPYFPVNWLQCREEDDNGDICGKWRRAPPTEVQTKDWECFYCVSWDPSRADCAVPQELETSEILKQLKYIKMLRLCLDAKRRKLVPKGRNRSLKKGKSS